MLEPKQMPADNEVALRVYPDMQNYVETEAEFLAAVDVGISDLDAGLIVSFEDVLAEFRQTSYREWSGLPRRPGPTYAKTKNGFCLGPGQLLPNVF